MVRSVVLLAATLSTFVGGITPSIAAPVPRIKAVRFERNGARSDAVSGDETAAMCRRFRLTNAEVTGFFTRAARVDAQGYGHDLDMSRCHAAGTIRFVDGSDARWTIDLARRGALMRPGRPPEYFYCLACTSPRFDPLDPETVDTAREIIRRSHTTR